MKNFKIFFLLFISFVFSWNAFASTIDNIEVTQNNLIKLTASEDVIFSDIDVVWDIKVLKDIPVSYSTKDQLNFKKVLLNLSSDLTANTSYSLISILGWEGNIDFRIADFLEWEIYNANLSEWEIGIEKINIIDSRTIEVYFSQDLLDDLFEFKILSEIPSNSLKSSGNNILDLEVSRNLEVSTNYILMILSLEDAIWNLLTFQEDLYDFVTPAVLLEQIEEEEVIVAEVKEEVIVEEEGNIEEVALNSAETPETGTATNILIAFALILNLLFFFRKKIIK